MIDLTKIDGIYLYAGATDLRKSIDKLFALILESFKTDELRNKIFLFSNKSRNRLKIIELDLDGVWLYQKRLTNDKFRWPKEEYGKMSLSKDELSYLLMGMDITQIHLPINFKHLY